MGGGAEAQERPGRPALLYSPLPRPLTTQHANAKRQGIHQRQQEGTGWSQGVRPLSLLQGHGTASLVLPSPGSGTLPPAEAGATAVSSLKRTKHREG